MIPVCRPMFIKSEKNFVYECLETNWISSQGKFVEGFEARFSKFCGVSHGISCTNGTTALHLALLSLEIGKGDEVIVPNFCMIAIPNSVTYTGAKPVFVDVDAGSWNIDPELIEKKITRRTKVIIASHNFGIPCDMDEINRIAKKHKLKVIEDGSEAHGATYKDKKVGSLSDIAIFSFYANKILTAGEGGMVVTNNEDLAKKCKSFRNHCFKEPRFMHDEIGYNYRMSNIHAAIAISQVEHADKLIGMRNEVGEMYKQQLKDVKGIYFQPEYFDGDKVCWMFCILVNEKEFGMSKETLMEFLKKAGVDTRSLFYPNHKQPCYKYLKIKVNYPVSEMLWEKGLYLPSSTDLTDLEIKRICETIKGAQNDR